MATTQAGSLAANANTVSRRIRRFITTLPAASSPTTLQLFLPRSMPRTAICMDPLLPLLRRSANLQRSTSGEGRAIHKGGECVGPNPTDRGKPGTKRHVIVDAGGIPLALLLSPANVH